MKQSALHKMSLLTDVQLKNRLFLLVLCLFLFCITSLLVEAHPPDHPGVSQTKHSADDASTHNAQYDHDAFLGKEDAKEFKKLTPEESKKRLAKIVKKVDTDHDGRITEAELHDWVKQVAKRSHDKEVSDQWAIVNNENKPSLDFTSYALRTYGPEKERLRDPETAPRYTEAIRRDKRRWKAADVNSDGNLTIEEFAAFLRAEDKPHMTGVLVEETMESIDKDKDGSISLTEYLADMGNSMHVDPKEAVPGSEWAKRFEDEFRVHRDKNKDGKMDNSDVKEWIQPTGYNPHEAEAKHLVYYTDANKDGVLTEEEILQKYDMFVGSQATNYGEDLKHEEL